MPQFLVLGAALAALACEPAPPAERAAVPAPASGDLVSARLVADTTAFAPGAEHVIGLHLDLADGWHVYAAARNDTGAPVAATLTMPAGFGDTPALGQPMPQRHVAPGDLLDHVYEHAVTLPAHVTVPRDSQPGSSVTFRAHVDWFVCKDICVPGGADVLLTVPIVASAADQQPSTDAPLLREAEARLPRRLAEHDRVNFSLNGDVLQLQAAGATSLLFVPSPDCTALPQLLADGAAQGQELRLHLDPERSADAVVAGALEVRLGGPAPACLAVRFDVPPAARAPGSAAGSASSGSDPAR